MQTTPKIALQLPDDGEPGWGAMCRTNFSKLDQLAVGQNLVKTLTGGTYALLPTEFTADSYEFNGALTSNQTVVFPNNMPPFAIENLTTGAFTLTVKTALGANVLIPQGGLVMLYANGTNIEALTMPAITQLLSATTTIVSPVASVATVVALAAFANNGNNLAAIAANSITILETGWYHLKGRIGGVTTAAAQTLVVQIAKAGSGAYAPKEIAQNPAAVATQLSASVDVVAKLIAGEVIALWATSSVASGVTLGIGQCSLIAEKVN